MSASDERVLKNAQHEIMRLLKTQQHQCVDGAIVASLTGAATMDRGQEGEDFFYREDGARISFAVTLIYRGEVGTLLAYRFHLQFPPGAVPPFVRFDLNPEAGDDALSEPRCHIHTGAEQLRAAAPLMGPVEILGKLLYGMSLPG